VAGPCKRLWVHTPQAGRRGTEPASYPRQVQGPHPGYYNSFSLRFSTGSTTSEWHKLGKGIITGCPISVILFGLAMNMLVKSSEVQWRGLGHSAGADAEDRQQSDQRGGRSRRHIGGMWLAARSVGRAPPSHPEAVGGGHVALCTGPSPTGCRGPVATSRSKECP